MAASRSETTGAAHHAGRTLTDLLLARVTEAPSDIAFRQEGQAGQWMPVSWADFHEQVTSLRHALHARGLRKGDRLALLAPVSLQWELLHHAALSLGVVVVGLDTHDLPDRIARMVDTASIAAFATSDLRVLSRVRPQMLLAARFVLRLAGPDAAVPAGTRLIDWAGLQTSATRHPERPGTNVDPPRATDPATIIFTSGTTGEPKGIAYSHGQLCLAIDAICAAFAFIGPQGRLLCWLPLSNLFQRMVNLSGLHRGATTYLLGDPRRVMEVVADVSPDVFVGVPRFFEKLYAGVQAQVAAQPRLKRMLATWAWDVGCRTRRLERQGQSAPLRLRLAHAMADRWVLSRIRRVMGTRLRCMVAGSAPTPLPLLDAFHGLGWLVLEAYGLSENVLPMAMNRIDRYRFGSVGVPLAGNRIDIDAAGVVQVRGAGVFRTYVASSGPGPLDENGYYATGDIGRFDDDGFLHLTGRSGDLIKTSTGRRIAPAAVESQLCGLHGIDQCMVIGDGRKGLVALCTVDVASSDAQHRSLLVHRLQARVAQLNDLERPLGVLLLAQTFTIERGDLTANLKLRRKTIESRYGHAIEELYGSIERAGRGAALIIAQA